MLLTNNNLVTTPTGQNSNSNLNNSQQQNIHPSTALLIQFQANPSTSSAAANNYHEQLPFYSQHQNNNCNDGSNLSSAGSSVGPPINTDHVDASEKNDQPSTPAIGSMNAPQFGLFAGPSNYQNLNCNAKQHSTPGFPSRTKNSSSDQTTPPSTNSAQQKRKRKRKDQQPAPKIQSAGLTVYETPPKSIKPEKKIQDYFAGKVSDSFL